MAGAPIYNQRWVHTHPPLWAIIRRHGVVGNGLLVNHSVHVRRQTNKFVSRPGLPSENHEALHVSALASVWLQFCACSLPHWYSLRWHSGTTVCGPCVLWPLPNFTDNFDSLTDWLSIRSIRSIDGSIRSISNCKNHADCDSSFRNRSRDAKGRGLGAQQGDVSFAITDHIEPLNHVVHGTHNHGVCIKQHTIQSHHNTSISRCPFLTMSRAITTQHSSHLRSSYVM